MVTDKQHRLYLGLSKHRYPFRSFQYQEKLKFTSGSWSSIEKRAPMKTWTRICDAPVYIPCIEC